MLLLLAAFMSHFNTTAQIVQDFGSGRALRLTFALLLLAYTDNMPLWGLLRRRLTFRLDEAATRRKASLFTSLVFSMNFPQRHKIKAP